MKQKRRTKPERVAVGNVTVPIYARTKAGYEVFEVADYSNGLRRLRSFSNRDLARSEAKRIAMRLASGEVNAAQMRGTDAASYGRSIELLRQTGVPLELAAAHFAEAFRILKGDRIVDAAKFFAARNTENLPQKTVAEVVAEFLAAKQARGKSDRYLQDLRARLSRFAESFKVGIANVTTADVQLWLDRMQGEPQTVLNYRRVVYTLFEFARARGFILKGSNPVEDTERISASNGDTVEIYSPTELAALLKAASEKFKPCLALGAFAGLRSAEIERLEWSDIDLAGQFITVAADKAKTASRRLVPVLSALAEWLQPYAKARGRVWTGTHDEFYDAQQEAATAAGIAWKSNALRHSFISYRLAEIQNAAQVALEAGNSPSVVFRNYREIVKPTDAQRWFSVRPKQPANVIPAPIHAQA